MGHADLDSTWRDARQEPFWLDTPERPDPRPSLRGQRRTQLAVVGGGFTGLWTALLAKERDPGRDVVLLESDRIGWAASGRNGGFCSASLTHGEANGRARYPQEYDRLEQLGLQNLDEIEEAVARYKIECGFERTGSLDVATTPHQLRDLAGRPGLLDQAAVRAEVHSPAYLGGVWDQTGNAMVDPARLAWGLAAAAERAGVEVLEGTTVQALRSERNAVVLAADDGTIRADRVALGTNAFPALLRRVRRHIVPVYDYVLVTEPLSDEQLDAVGWRNRQGISDSGNQFHYYRLTPDNRVLWGGYDAIYHFGRRIRPEYDQRDATFRLLAGHFFETFPQLEGLHFTHRWGGAIDTCTRFFAFYGTALRGRAAYALGHTGLGVGAARFSGNVMLDLLSGQPTERTRLDMVRQRPLPFPPEPLAYLGIQATRWSLARADRTGRRNLWLRSLDRMGLGFDS
jgi:glycine/D-amino acid oxidase-like deaminating enzyme